MKLLTLIVHTDVQQDLTRLLYSMDQVSGFTFTHVEGHGEEEESDKFLSAKDKVIGYAPRVRVELLLNDNDVDSVLTMLSAREHNIAGQGIYWVIPAEKGGHLL